MSLIKQTRGAERSI